MAPRNKSMPPNRVNDTASEDASLHEDNAVAQQEEEVTAEEAWATAEGYTPLSETRTDGAVFMAFNPNQDDEENDGTTFSGAFFADMSAFGAVENYPDDEWGDEDQDSNEDEQQDNTEFRSVADQALQALDADYSMALSGTVDPPSTDFGAGMSSVAALPSETTFSTSHVSSDDGLKFFKQEDSTKKETYPIDTDAVRKAVDAIRLKAPRLTSDLNKWEEQHGVSNTSLVALAPREHAIIPKTPLSAFWRQSPKAIQATANLSRSATLAEAITRLAILDSLRTEQRLLIDIVGADHVECSSEETMRTMFAPLVRWIGALGEKSPQHIEIRLIGPDVPAEAAVRSPVNLMPSKKDATSRLQSATATCHSSVYHEWLQKEKDETSPPDIAIAFNSGIWGYNEWLPTLKALYESSSAVPFVSTAYTIQECEDDADVIENVISSTATKETELSQQCLWKPEANPFASRQIRETATAVEGREYRENAAWQAWKLGGCIK